MEHELKVWPRYFEAIQDGRKRFEVRRADRPFAVGDVLRLREYAEDHRFTGREARVRVTYLVSAAEVSVLSGVVGAGVVVMAFEPEGTTTGGLPLLAGPLESPPIHIPDESGGAFKTELVVQRDPARGTTKLLWWHADDPRGDPHNHPWDFESRILSGGYTEDRFWLEGGRVQRDVLRHQAGDLVRVPRTVFHRVRDVLPGTRTRLECGPAAPGNEWGYLDPRAGQYRRATLDPDFLERLRALNPHLRGPG